jgi:hypothetical protein
MSRDTRPSSVRVCLFRHGPVSGPPPRCRTGPGLVFKASASATWASDGWCPRRDSNPHASRQPLLKRPRLPVPPRGLCSLPRRCRTSSIGRRRGTCSSAARGSGSTRRSRRTSMRCSCDYPLFSLAEAEGFEPPSLLRAPVFETGDAANPSTPPQIHVSRALSRMVAGLRWLLDAGEIHPSRRTNSSGPLGPS